MNSLFCALSLHEFNTISYWCSAIAIWHIFKVTLEGINQDNICLMTLRSETFELDNPLDLNDDKIFSYEKLSNVFEEFHKDI